LLNKLNVVERTNANNNVNDRMIVCFDFGDIKQDWDYFQNSGNAV
jgi:hypothetical protein